MIHSLRFSIQRNLNFNFRSSVHKKSLPFSNSASRFHRRQFASSSPPAGATLGSEDAARLREFQENFVGGRRIQLTNSMQFIDSATMDAIPIFRVMDLDGKVINEAHDPKFPKEKLVDIYKKVRLFFRLQIFETWVNSRKTNFYNFTNL